jgi:hypothetical protein
MDAGQFLRDVTKHVMTVKRDDGMYRHIRYAQPENSNMWFDLVTWPGVLTIHGDMGTWTFSRVPDMFTFFRDHKLRVNHSYWAEKLQHGTHGGRDGARVWSDDLFRDQLRDSVKDSGLEGDDLTAVMDALEEDVLRQDNKYELLIAARDFSCKIPSRESERYGKFQFDELPDGKEYAYHFSWCLYAIVWGIQQYDGRDHQTTTEVSGSLAGGNAGADLQKEG